MVPAGTRRADRELRPPGHPRRAGLACLTAGLLTALSCATLRAPAEGPHGGDPRPLHSEEGTSVTGRLRPGETALYSVSLEEDQYLELHLDRDPDELTGFLYGPGVEPTGSEAAACSWTELAPDVEGQVLWELAQTSGTHQLQLRPKGDEPVSYTLTIAALRPGTSRDRARHRCDESFPEAQSVLRNGRLGEALERFDRTLELCLEGEYARAVAVTLDSRARVLQDLGRHDEAREALETAFEVWSSIGEKRSMAGILVSLAGLERRVANWARAQEVLDAGLRLAREARYRLVEANALDQYCRIFIEMGNTERAIDECRNAVALWEDIEDPYRVIDSLINLGYIHRYIGEVESARAYFQRGMEIVRQHSNDRQEATLRANLASIHESKGEYWEALAQYREAAERHQAAGELDRAALALQNIGKLDRKLGKLDAALDYFHRALTLMDRAGDRLGRIVVLHSLGELHRERGELSDARRRLEQALVLSRQSNAPPYLVESLLLMGRLQLAEGRPDHALASLEEALELSREIRNRWVETDVLADMAQVYSTLGRDGRALDLLFEAADISSEIGDRTGAAETRYRMARIERRRGNLQVARRAVEEALALVEEIGTVVGSSELRTLFSAATRPYHELYIDILVMQHERQPDGGHLAEALRASERARAQSLLEILSEWELGPGPEVPEELLGERTDLLQSLNGKELERQRLLTDEGTDPAELLGVKLDLEGLLHDLRDVERRIRSASPRYAALTRPEPVSVGEIQRSILDRETALLEYSLGEDRSFLWVVTQDDFRHYQLPGRDVLERGARCLYRLIAAFGDPSPVGSLDRETTACLGRHIETYREVESSSDSLRVRARRKWVIELAFEEVATHLFQHLLGGPSRDGILPFRLAIVSDGALEYVPFATLPDSSGEGRPLVWSHEVVRQPSASVLALQRRSKPTPAPDYSGELAIIADPLYSPDDDRITEPSPSYPSDRRGVPRTGREEPGRAYVRLTFAEQEARGIARFTPDNRVFLALGANASRETVLSGALSGYRYVHFATHGTIDTRFPELSSLVLSLVDDEGRAHDDGYLRLNDIYGLKLDATDMVVLSACETALGREVRGEGLVGLTRGFLYAGAERVVASLWQVQDRATARLMEHLYRGLLEEGRPPAEALRHAQLAFLDEGGRLAFPYYWAGFVLQGEWR